jgi:hypothetical protein
MSRVLDQVRREQCGNPEADYDFESDREVMSCREG